MLSSNGHWASRRISDAETAHRSASPVGRGGFVLQGGVAAVGREYELDEDEVGFGGEAARGETVIPRAVPSSSVPGIIRAPESQSYVIAVGAYNGTFWPVMTSWVGMSSCRVFGARRRPDRMWAHQGPRCHPRTSCRADR